MGRAKNSQGLAPPAIRKDVRAKQARNIINKVLPAILASNGRARRGADSSELIIDPQRTESREQAQRQNSTERSEEASYVKRKGQRRRKVKTNEGVTDDAITKPVLQTGSKGKGNGKRSGATLDETPSNPNPTTPESKRTIRIITIDTLTAAHMLTHPSRFATNISINTPINTTIPPVKPNKKAPNTCILNMASPLRPGGGVLHGATSQEEFLCARTTLLPSLAESFYRLPELGGVFTPDVLVFRSALPLGDPYGDLGPGARYFVDVISAGMLRFPELEGADDGVKRLGRRDMYVVESKIRAVLRIAERKGVRRLVLGAWGCGAYGNPVGDVAGAFARILDGRDGGTSRENREGDVERWSGLEEVVFAINNRRMAEEFARGFGGHVGVENGPDDNASGEDVGDEEDEAAEELRTKIKELEGQSSKVWNPELKVRLDAILDGLKTQLREREGGGEEDDDNESEQHVGHQESKGGGVTLGIEVSGEDEDVGDESSEAYYETSGDAPESLGIQR